MRRFLFFAVIMFLIVPTLSYGSTAYYFDSGAPDGGDGTLSKPWNRLSQLKNFKFATSDGLYFKAGTTVYIGPGERINITWDGAPGAPAVVGAYHRNGIKGLGGGERPIISGLINGSRVGGILHSGAINYNRAGLGYIHVKDLHITDVIGYGVSLGGRNSPVGYITNCRVENVKTTFTNSQGIGLYHTHNSIVENCWVEDSNQDQDNYFSGVGIDIGAVNRVGSSRDNIVRGNTVIRGSEGIGMYKGTIDTLVEYNNVIDCRTFHIYLANARGAIIRHNLVYSAGYTGCWGLPGGRQRCRTSPNGGWGIVTDSEGHIDTIVKMVGDAQIYNNYIAGMHAGIVMLNNSGADGVYQAGNRIYDNRIVDCNQNFRFNHDDDTWRDNLIFQNYSFILTDGLSHTNKMSPIGITWNGNHFNTTKSKVFGNASNNAILDKFRLENEIGFRAQQTGKLYPSDFKFIDENDSFSNESPKRPDPPSNFLKVN